MRLFYNTNFDFMGWRKIAIAISVMMIFIGLASLFIKGGPAYSVDFLGGTELQIQFLQPRDPQDIRGVMASLNYGDAEIKEYGNPRDFLIRFRESKIEAVNTENIMAALNQAFPADPPQLLATNIVGPKIGQELRDSAIWAVMVSLVLLLVYIGFRFDFIFGVGAVIALFHDVIITLGFLSVLNREISIAVVAAFLTLVGYSLNDTIVVFDRIRENLKKRQREHLPIEQIVNMSINETLSRTIVTGVTTLIVIIVCLFFGGEVLRDFFLCLLFGILVGTYSSIFIASPVVVDWYSTRRKHKEKHAIIVESRKSVNVGASQEKPKRHFDPI